MLPNNWRYLRGDIYYADMEPHIGSEQGGKRPVVVPITTLETVIRLH